MNAVSFPRLLLLIVLFPLIDFALLAWIAGRVPLDWMLLWVVGTAVLGIVIIRRERAFGLRSTATGQPGHGLLDHVSILAAGALLVLPGVVGHALALVLLVPWLRRPLVVWGVGRLAGRLAHRFGLDQSESQRSDQRSGARVIDVQVIEPQGPGRA